MRENERGATIKVDGETYVLTYDFNTLCNLEADGVDLMEGKVEAAKLRSPSYIRNLFFTGCTDAKGQPLPDAAAAGAIIHKIGLMEAMKKIMEALSVSIAGGDGENPQKAQPTP